MNKNEIGREVNSLVCFVKVVSLFVNSFMQTNVTFTHLAKIKRSDLVLSFLCSY